MSNPLRILIQELFHRARPKVLAMARLVIGAFDQADPSPFITEDLIRPERVVCANFRRWRRGPHHGAARGAGSFPCLTMGHIWSQAKGRLNSP